MAKLLERVSAFTAIFADFFINSLTCHQLKWLNRAGQASYKFGIISLPNLDNKAQVFEFCYLGNISQQRLKVKNVDLFNCIETKEVLPSIRKLNVPIANKEKFLSQVQEQQRLQSFNYQGKILDYGLLNGEPIFNLNAIGELLNIVNPRTTIDTSDSDYVIKVDNSIVGFAYNRKLHNTGELFLTESGLYMLLMRSNNPNAKPFQKWVAKEVLPSIRKNGGYIAGQENLSEEQLLAKALLVANNVIQRKDKVIAEQAEVIADQKEVINAYKITDKTRRNKQELATLLNRKIRELADKQYSRQYSKCYNDVYAEFGKQHYFTHKIDMQFLKTNIDYLSECLKLVLDKLG